MLRVLIFVGAYLLASLSSACLWDSDTVAVELKGMPELQDVIAGRFERNPDLYYEIRLARIESKKDWHREDYFDKAVALDRLGRHDEAIAWLADNTMAYMRHFASKEELEKYEYMFSANLGTFYIHRGLKKGEEGLEDLNVGLELVEKAIEINPDAHFGREKVQVALVKHLIWDKGKEAKIARLEANGETDKVSEVRYERVPPTDLTREEIREGVIGLMVLGNAWESPVAWHWLWGSLKTSDGNMRKLIEQRIKELDPDYMSAKWEKLPRPLGAYPGFVSQESRINRVYWKLRENGNEWAENREAFMVERLRAGKHPDSDEDFWEGYMEVPPTVVRDTLADKFVVWSALPGSQIIVAMVGAMGLAIGVFVWKSRRRGARG